jgi:hypothetical protein
MPIFLVKQFVKGERAKEYNTQLQDDVHEHAEALGYGDKPPVIFADASILAPEKGGIDITYSVYGKEKHYGPVTYSMEAQSVELMVLTKVKLPKGVRMNDFIHHDAELDNTGKPLHRKSIVINLKDGVAMEYQYGVLNSKIPLQQWLDSNIDLEKTNGVYCTVKVSSAGAANPTLFASLAPLTKGYPEYEKVFKEAQPLISIKRAEESQNPVQKVHT